MGYFIEIKDTDASTDLRQRYSIGREPIYENVRCQHVDGEAGQCSFYTVLRPEGDGTRHCYFHHIDALVTVGKDSFFDTIMARSASVCTRHEEEASIKYYFDNYSHIKNNLEGINTIVEVGCYLGGATVMFAQIAHALGLQFYVVELNFYYMLFTYERLLRVAPETLDSVRFYNGTLADFTSQYQLPLRERSIYLVQDASHSYDGVLADLVATYDIRQGIHSMAFHDFHLRSADWKMDVYVDRAIYAVFGVNANLRKIGFYTGEFFGTPEKQIANDKSGYGLYARANSFESVIIVLSENTYCFDKTTVLRHPVPLEIERRAAWLKERFDVGAYYLDKALSKFVLRPLRQSGVRRLLGELTNPRPPQAQKSPPTSGGRPYLYEPQEPTGIELVFPIEAGKAIDGSVQLQVGDTRGVATVGRVYVQYDRGRSYREVPDVAAVEVVVESPSVVRVDGLQLEGLEVGRSVVSFRYMGFSRDISVEVLSPAASDAAA
ncbi:MAG: hypothetical protein HQL02_07440 [Nitrospirae bacterium]|nr:hypothetical protein [Nitrospirota bacterium]